MIEGGLILSQRGRSSRVYTKSIDLRSLTRRGLLGATNVGPLNSDPCRLKSRNKLTEILAFVSSQTGEPLSLPPPLPWLPVASFSPIRVLTG